MKNLLNKIFLFTLSLSFIIALNNYNEIEYYTDRFYRLTHTKSKFSVKFNKKDGIQARLHDIKEAYYENYSIYEDYKLKIYNLTNEELGIMPMKELFKNFNKINFPNETDWAEMIFDVFDWHLIVDGKDYYSNVRTEFYDKFDDLVDINHIREYVENLYYNKTSSKE